MVSDALKKWSEKSGHDHHHKEKPGHRKHKTKYQRELEYREEVERRKEARGINFFFTF